MTRRRGRFVRCASVDGGNLTRELEDGNDGLDERDGLLLDEEVGREDGPSSPSHEGSDASGVGLREKSRGSESEVVQRAGGGTSLVGILDGVEVCVQMSEKLTEGAERRTRKKCTDGSFVRQVVEDIDALDGSVTSATLEPKHEVNPLVQVGAHVVGFESLRNREVSKKRGEGKGATLPLGFVQRRDEDHLSPKEAVRRRRYLRRILDGFLGDTKRQQNEAERKQLGSPKASPLALRRKSGR